MEDQLVSIIIPIYNAEKTIANVIASVFNQTYQNYEVILINDGSTDRTHDIITNIISSEQKYEKVKYFLQPNSGPSAARNYGIEKSSGTFIAFLDSDDLWYSDKLFLQIELFDLLPNVVMIGGAVGNEGDFKKYRQLEVTFNKELFKNYFLTSTVIIRSNVVKKILFDANQKYSEDYKLWLQVCYEFKSIYIHRPLAKNQFNKRLFGDMGLSANLWAMEKGELSNYKFLLKSNKIGFSKYILVCAFSLMKYVRRCLIIKLAN